ncbi:trypsin-like peptidase domain-containing protein [Gemmobacter fulvus]|uniref:trypsin-like serine peptidase n=1 Tax=Gemmobacter fulvus TaxID=2840474 RepID=UPI002796DEF6|nr:trypsin-like peptidase domain-containing protein [Gemmobacter fulvus]MDQ1848846.1 trypsin-like peptidase domain-containing protein [Gemmobacter fulvus]
MRLIATLALMLMCLPALAQDARLRSLQTGDDSRGWDAVGRLNLGRKGFCTGALIAPDLVLTAGHCLFDKETGARIDPTEIEFLAGWRNGRAAAYRHVKRAVAHPDFVFGGQEKLERVTHDLALLQLDQPIRLPSILPFETDSQPLTGSSVGVVSYAKDRAEAPSLQEMCEVLAQKPEMLILSCDVDFGASGSPVFSLRGGVARVVSVVSAKAEVEGKPVALGTSLEGPLADLRAEMAETSGTMPGGTASVRRMGGQGGGAKFLRPETRP